LELQGVGVPPIWADFMINAMEGEPERDFIIPENIRFEKVDPGTGCPPAEDGQGYSIPLKKNQTLCREAVQ
jgi:membrane carboxypeptidase/penicillin-binding protein